MNQTVLSTDQPLCYDGLVIDKLSRQVYRSGSEIHLTKGEFNLLYYLMEHRCEVLTPSQIYEAIWGYDFCDSSARLRVRIGHLRHKLGQPQIIHTIRGFGYILKREVSNG